MNKAEKPKDSKTDATSVELLNRFDSLIDAMRGANNEILQLEELKGHTEKLKWDFICYLMDILEEYDMTLKIPASSLPDIKALRAVYFNGTGIVSFHFRDGSVKSYEMRHYPTIDLLKIVHAAMPHLRTALGQKRREYEDLSNLLTKIGKHVLFHKEEPNSLTKAHSL